MFGSESFPYGNDFKPISHILSHQFQGTWSYVEDLDNLELNLTQDDKCGSIWILLQLAIQFN